MQFRRVLIEVEVVYDADELGIIEHEGHVDLAELAHEAREGNVSAKVKVARNEVCTPRRAALVLMGHGKDPREAAMFKGDPPEPGGRGLRPSYMVESLRDGVESDIAILRQQEENYTGVPDLDALLGTLQQMPQEELDDIMECRGFSPRHRVDVIQEVRELIEDHGGECLLDQLPDHTEDEPARSVAMAPLIDGPIFTLTIWDDGMTQPNGKAGLRYELRQDGELIFAGADFGCSPLHATDSLASIRALLTFLTLRPGDTDAEYFESYTPRQMAFAEEFGEVLSLYAIDELDEGDDYPFDWDSMPEDERDERD